MIRIISLILAGLLTVTTLVSCGETARSGDVSAAADTEAAETEPETTAYPVGIKNYEGRDFRISVNSKYLDEMWVEAENGDVCNDAVYNRNTLIEDLFNVRITPVVSQYEVNETQVNAITASLLAGDDVYDIVAVYTYLAGRPALQGMYVDWGQVPNVDFSREWWVQSANEAFSVGGRRYVAVGDLSVTTLLLSWGVFFNRRLVENYGIADLYETVKSGDWTIDELIALTADTYQDLDGNNRKDASDFYGFAGETVTNLDAWTASLDIPLIAAGSDGYPELVMNLEKMVTAVEKLNQLYYSNNSTFWVEGDLDTTPFVSGNVIFMTTYMNNAFTMFRAMEDDYGILPFPKYDAAQDEYYSNAMDNYSLLSVPVTATDLGFVGAVTEALNCESHLTVMPAYYEVALTTKYARDTDSVAMLDIIMNGRQYDFSILHGSSLANLPYFLRTEVQKRSGKVVSDFEAIREKVNVGLADVVAAYRTVE